MKDFENQSIDLLNEIKKCGGLLPYTTRYDMFRQMRDLKNKLTLKSIALSETQTK